ncbi:MAG: hypothetical protein Ct9H90mP27_7540 [Gammaproteobacteria bacterium]|nr:MAG: hypothetical protein Ct9H90mP27_7540 [Gammaproteobacteria bacterium]
MRASLGEGLAKVMDIIRSKLPEMVCLLEIRQFLLITGVTRNFLFTYLERRLIRPLGYWSWFSDEYRRCDCTGKKTVVIHGDGGFMFHETRTGYGGSVKSPRSCLCFQ